MLRCPAWFMDPTEYNVLVKLHTSGITRRSASVERNVVWRERCLESESIRHTTELVEVTRTEEPTTSRRVHIVTPEVVHHVVPMVTYWREVVEYPSFLRRLYDMHVTKGHNGMLEVRAAGIPKPDVVWYKDWQPLTSNSKYTITHYDPDVYTMTINNADEHDQALYSCRISNHAGSVHTSSFVHVDRDASRISYYDNLFAITDD